MILFITEASPRIGYDHVRRSVAFADALREQGVEDIRFQVSGVEARREVEAAQFVLDGGSKYNAPIDALIIDELRPVVPRLGQLVTCAVVDELHEAPAEADIVFALIPPGGYVHTINVWGLVCSGGEYAILGRGFWPSPTRPKWKSRGRAMPTVLLAFEGADPLHFTEWIAQAWGRSGLEAVVIALVTPAFGRTLPDYIAHSVSNDTPNEQHLPQLLADASLLICSGGTIAVEARCIGTPMIVIPQNQREVSRMAGVMGMAGVDGGGAHRAAGRLREIIEACRAKK